MTGIDILKRQQDSARATLRCVQHASCHLRLPGQNIPLFCGAESRGVILSVLLFEYIHCRFDTTLGLRLPGFLPGPETLGTPSGTAGLKRRSRQM